MKPTEQVRGYQGGYLIGVIIIATTVLRTIIFYLGQAELNLVIACLVFYGLLYTPEPWLSARFRWFKFLYFPLQSFSVILLTNLRPFTEVSSLLYIPLFLQVFRSFTRKAEIAWSILFAVLLCVTMFRGAGWLGGTVLALLYLTFCVFLTSYDSLYIRTRADQAESQRLLADLQAAHRKLEQYSAQVEELTAARERNQLVRELHDSVSQAIFGITLTSQSTRLLLEREPARVPGQINRLQEMTASILSQLRSIIAELRPR
jgi:signal transduction histidine kinase